MHAGQGVVFETMGLSDLHNYTTGGTIHVVVNNQIGFTTTPRESRSSRYCTDVAKAIDAPIFHVNGDDVDAVVAVCELAADFRQAFGRDAVVDLVCYRRHGHQEIDNPMFTSPIMYSAIKSHPTVLQLYTRQLLDDGVVSQTDVDQIKRQQLAKFEVEYNARNEARAPAAKAAGEVHTRAPPAETPRALVETGVAVGELQRLGRELTALPNALTPHRVVAALYKQRVKMVEGGSDVDWALAEQLAFASLAAQGFPVRLSGQDVERGTFSHRHAVVHDQKLADTKYVPLQHLTGGGGGGGGGGGSSGSGGSGGHRGSESIDAGSSDDDGGIGERVARVELCNSSLSEFAVLGFELGYSLESPNALVLWEAQFGDFANTAQCIVDQFISSGEAKWRCQTGLVLLLPHGLEGGGPEHSSARLERYLQLCDDDERSLPPPDAATAGAGVAAMLANMQVVNVTTPANYFHALRRQLARPFRKPLVVMAPKSLLRHRLVRSPLAALGPGTKFEAVLPAIAADELVPPEDVRKLVFCTGRVHVDLVTACAARAEGSPEAQAEREVGAATAAPNMAPNTVPKGDVAIIKLEELCPFPHDGVRQALRRYPAAEIVWCQEEPLNAGAWAYVRPRLELASRGAPRSTAQAKPVTYVGRPPAAATATGLTELHELELKRLVAEAVC